MRSAMRIAGRLVLGAAALVVGWSGAELVVGGRPAAAVDPPASAAPTAASAPTFVMVPMVLVVPAPTPPPAPPAPPAPQPTHAAIGVPRDLPVPVVDAPLIGTFRMTRYYVAEESGFARSHSDQVVLADGVPTDDVTIYDDRGCRKLATIGRGFTEVLDIQGTGKLRDGRVINVSGPCRCGHSPCYRPMSERAQWGMGAISRPLEPFRSIAVDPKVVKLGSVLYVAELDGLTMPGEHPWGGYVHDGCVVATDVGGGIDGMQIDFFVGKAAWKRSIDARRKMKYVHVYRGEDRCGRPGRPRASSGADT